MNKTERNKIFKILEELNIEIGDFKNIESDKKIKKSRIKHICSCCNSVIEKGSSYRNITLIRKIRTNSRNRSSFTFKDIKLCNECESISVKREEREEIVEFYKRIFKKD